MSTRSTHDVLEDQLKSMVGKTYLVNTFLQVVETWSYEGDKCHLKTSKRTYKEPINDMLKFVRSEFHEADPEAAQSESTELSRLTQELIQPPKLAAFDACDSFMESLKRAMDKVETNADFKPQADSMANIAKQAIDYAKVQVNAIKTVNDIVRNR